MPSLPSGGRARARARGSAPAALAALAVLALALAFATLPLVAREARAKEKPCVYFDCTGGASDTSGSPGRSGDYLIQVAGLPVIAYSDSLAGDLRVARRTAAAGWVIETVDAAGDVGAAPSMAADELGDLVITYYDATHGDLKLARSAPGGWTLERVDTMGDVGRHSSLATYPGGAAIAYFDATSGALKYAERPVGGVEWQTQVIDGGGSGGGPGVGLYPSLIARANERAISYYDREHGTLKLAIRIGGAWNTMTVDASGDVGGWSSLCRTLSGFGIAYYDFTDHALRYAWSLGPGPPWTIESVDAAGDVGRYCSAFAFTPQPDDRIGISYYDATNGDLKYAQKRGTWSAFAVDTSGDVGGFTACAGGMAPGDTLGLAYFDYTNSDLLYASHLNPTTGVATLDRVRSHAHVAWLRDAAGGGGRIRYAVPAGGDVRLGLYDASGRVVVTLIHEPRGAEDGELGWDGRDTRGRVVSPGVYFLRLDTVAGSATAPAVFVR